MKYLLSLILVFGFFNHVKSQSQNEAYDIHILPSREFVATGNVHDLYLDKDGYMWYSTEENLCRDNGYQLDVFCSDDEHPDLIGSNFVLDISEDNDGHLWFGTAKGVFIIDKHNFNIHAVCPDETRGIECEALLALSDGSVWVCMRQYILHLDRNEKILKKIPTNHNPIKGRYAESFYEDSHGNLWLLESGGGICRFDSIKQQFVRYENSFIAPRRIVEDSIRKCYWVGTWGKGVYKFIPDLKSDSGSFEQQVATMPLNNQTDSKAQIIDLILDSRTPVLWVSSMDGLHSYTCNSEYLEEQNLNGLLPPGKNIVDRMEHDNQGNIWVSAFSPHTFILTSRNRLIRRNRMSSVLENTGNSVIGDFAISDVSGIWIWDPRNGLIFENRESGNIVLASSFTEDNVMHGSGVITPMRDENKFWMSSGDNIVKLWHEGEVIRRELFTNLNGCDIFGLYEPGDGFLWVASTKGIKKYNM